MRVIPNRTGAMPARPLRIVSLLRGRWDEQRSPALQALADLGHEVVYVDELLSRDGYRKLFQRLRFDVAVLWGSSLQNFLMTESEHFLLEELGIPYVSLWTDNPIKHLFLLKDVKTPLHRGLFVADTRVIEQLEALGWDNVFYLPPWHIDPQIFYPTAPDPALACTVSFAATVNPYAAERAKWRYFWDHRMNGAADAVMAEVRRQRDHVDTWDALSGDWDPWSLEFSLISHAMYFEQKAVVRELVIEAMQGRPLSITGIGSASNLPANVTMNRGREWNDLNSTFASATVNLNCTPWPRSCHHRVFQTTACRALAVTDWREDSLALYEPDHEVVYFKSMDELGAIVDRFSAAPEDAKRIAEAGYRRFLAHHTAAHRMAEFSRVLADLV
jgi:spore maturation protein CgeB